MQQYKHKLQWHIHAPANLLLLGEYAITDPHGMGIALAVNPRAHAYIYTPVSETEAETHAAFVQCLHKNTITKHFAIYASFAGKHVMLHPHEEFMQTVLQCIFHQQAMPRTTTPQAPSDVEPEGAAVQKQKIRSSARWYMKIDTSTFFHTATGKKRGLGSSAVSCLLAVSGLMKLADIPHTQSQLVHLAIRTHRAMHGGSGYDIACSALGSCIVFHGGSTPTWKYSNLPLQWKHAGIALCSWQSGIPVSSKNAVHTFSKLYPAGSTHRQQYITKSNAVVKDMLYAQNWESWKNTVNRARSLGEEIGNIIGISAALPKKNRSPKHQINSAQADSIEHAAKAAGAGNERGIIFACIPPDKKTLYSNTIVEYLQMYYKNVQMIEYAAQGLCCAKIQPVLS